MSCPAGFSMGVYIDIIKKEITMGIKDGVRFLE